MAVGVDESKHSSSGLEFKLHPLVLINISDHHTRIKANSPSGSSCPPVLGILLGSQTGRLVDVSNSFELKYSLNADSGVELDAAFLTKKSEQYKTVFPKLDVVGWYATGSTLHPVHMTLHRKVLHLTEAPLFLLLDPAVNPATARELPITLLETELHTTEGGPSLQFVRAHYSVETSDAERIGVDQVAKILPGGKASGSEQLAAHLGSLHSAIKMLLAKLRLLQDLLRQVHSGAAPFPHSLMRQVNTLVAALPCLRGQQLEEALAAEHCDSLAVLYLSIMTKGTSTLNELADKVVIAYERSGGATKAVRGGARAGGGSMGVY